MRLRTSIEVTIEVEIARPPPVVWLFVSDLERLPEWLGEFESVRTESDGPNAVGTVFHYTVRPSHRSGTFEIVEWEPGHRMAWDGPPLAWGGGAARPRGYFEVVAAGVGRSLFKSRWQPELTGTQVLLRPYLKRWLRRRRQADTNTVKTMLEADTPS